MAYHWLDDGVKTIGSNFWFSVFSIISSINYLTKEKSKLFFIYSDNDKHQSLRPLLFWPIRITFPIPQIFD